MSEEKKEYTLWHTLSIEETVERTKTNLSSGLTDKEAEDRLARDGLNKLPDPKRLPAILKFLLQFHSALIYLLIVVMIFCFATQEWV